MTVKFRLEIIESCDSTNELLLRERNSDSFHGRCVLSRKQSQGRGRRGREWTSLDGNLFLSIGLRLPLQGLSPSLLPFSLAAAVAEVLESIVSTKGPPIRLKWPNDIYLGRKKLGGILTQARQSHEAIDLVIGLGLNLAQTPDSSKTSVPAISLNEVFSPVPKPEELATFLLEAWEKEWASGLSYIGIESKWTRYARLPEGKMVVSDSGEIVQPTKINSFGALEVLDSQGNVKTLSAEEVSVRWKE